MSLFLRSSYRLLGADGHLVKYSWQAAREISRLKARCVRVFQVFSKMNPSENAVIDNPPGHNRIDRTSRRKMHRLMENLKQNTKQLQRAARHIDPTHQNIRLRDATARKSSTGSWSLPWRLELCGFFGNILRLSKEVNMTRLFASYMLFCWFLKIRPHFSSFAAASPSKWANLSQTTSFT